MEVNTVPAAVTFVIVKQGRYSNANSCATAQYFIKSLYFFIQCAIIKLSIFMCGIIKSG